MRNLILILTSLFILGCNQGEDMATIGEEVNGELVSTNVTDDTTNFTESAVTVSVGGEHSAIIKNDGELWTTGGNSHGELGLGDETDRNSFTDTEIRDVKSVSLGSGHSAIIKNDGSLWVSGNNFHGQLGLGDNDDRNVFTDTGIRDVSIVSAGRISLFIIKNDGSLWCTGNNLYGHLGLGDNTNRNSFTDTGITAKQVSSNGDTFIIKTDDTLWATGFNAYGQLGLGDETMRTSFTDTGITAKQVSSGFTHTIIIKTDDTVWATGHNSHGELGIGNNNNKNIFTSTGVSAKQVDAGVYFSLLVKADDTLWATGDNQYGALGLGNNDNKNIFTDTGVTVNYAMCYGYYSFILKSSDDLWATGTNYSGQLGLGDNDDTNSFTDTSEVADEFIWYSWTAHIDGSIVKRGDYLYLVSCFDGYGSPCIFVDLTQIGLINQLKPFDGTNITPAIFPSPMTYTVKGLESFNSFTLAKVLASSITYSFTLPIGDDNYDLWLDGVEVSSGGNGVVKTDTVAIDCKRDPGGILSLYPTTVIFYADYQMPVDSTVTISLAHTDDIELGDFTLNNAVCSSFTQLAFNHGIQDFNDYTPDAWGSIPKRTKGIVTKFNITCDLYLSNYDYAVSFLESIRGRFVSIDGSDAMGVPSDGETKFSSLSRRVMVTGSTPATIVKDGALDKMANVKLSVQEVI